MERYNPDIHHRRSIRLKGYNYSQAGGYFITLCCYDRQCLFGHVQNGEMTLNQFGKIAHDEWIISAQIRTEIKLHQFVVMPNHIHGIIEIKNGAGGRGDRPVAQKSMGGGVLSMGDVVLLEGDQPVAPTGVRPTGPCPKSIGVMIAGYKSSVTAQINTLRNSPGLHVWQRNFYDNIIRDDESWQNIKNYIVNNPAKWLDDRFYNDKS
jgi:putative transposase